MSGEMCWLPSFGTDGDKILHLRTNSTQPWQPYTACPRFAVPDYAIPRGTKGWATYQKLMKQQWTLIPSDRALRELSWFNQDLEERRAS
ncbi:hypothetical protein [Allocoleopsis sp.]|uniref:hypothetical protein n=1 Tax=Allocoleopsis sp. TaxID=3088169 RepID=UPI002FCED4E6